MGDHLDRLMRLMRLIRSAWRDALADLDVTPVQNSVLRLIAGASGISSAELARRAHVSPQSMHTVVTELERRALVKLEPRPGHGRILDAHITEQGRALLGETDVLANALEERMIAGLDEDRRRQLLDLLHLCLASFEEPHDR